MDVTAMIEAAYDAEVAEEPREYIGASGIGSGCDAELAFSLRGFPNNLTPSRTKRIFELGHIIEDIILNDLTRAGLNVKARQDNGKQFGASILNGHVKGHADGLLVLGNGEEAILEAKSMNKSKFSAFKKHGVQESHPYYYSQVQMLMGLMDKKHALLVGYCKDNSEYHHQWLTRDLFAFEAQSVRIATVMFGESYKIAKDEADWRCKSMCFKSDVCWRNADVPVKCSTCAFGSPSMDSEKEGKWSCNVGLTFEEGCKSWERYQPKSRK